MAHKESPNSIGLTVCSSDQGPGLQSFLKVKVTLTLREVISDNENLHLIRIHCKKFP